MSTWKIKKKSKTTYQDLLNLDKSKIEIEYLDISQSRQGTIIEKKEKDYYNFIDKTNKKMCVPYVQELNIKGMLGVPHIHKLRNFFMRDIPNLAIEYMNFKTHETNILPEHISLRLQSIPLRYIGGNYQDVVDFVGYYQCELHIKAEDSALVVYPDMINFEKFNTPLEIPEHVRSNPLFVLEQGEELFIHCYISKNKPIEHTRWTSTTTFKYLNNTENELSMDYYIYIEGNGSIDIKDMLEYSISQIPEKYE